jgi:aminoacrylate hydrolase
MSADMTIVEVAGGHIAYEVEGSGDAAVFVSGLGGMAAFWQAQRRRFGSSCRVIAFDHRGVGRSTGVPPYSVLQWSHDLLALLDHVGAGRVHLVGHSTGGIIAQTFAVAHPDRVRSLALGGTWLKPDRRFRDQFAFRKQVLSQLGGDGYRMLGDLLAYPASDATTQVASNVPMSTRERNVILGRIDALLAYDGEMIAPRIAAPTIVLSASDDYIVPAYLSDALASAIPGARQVRFEGGGHFFPKTRADDYNAVLADFWTEAGR